MLDDVPPETDGATGASPARRAAGTAAAAAPSGAGRGYEMLLTAMRSAAAGIAAFALLPATACRAVAEVAA